MTRAAGFVTATLVLGIGAAGMAEAQSIDELLGSGGSLSNRAVQLIALITVLSLAPGIAVMVTCFPFIVTVLSILRTGLGLQSSPPNMMIVSLALFLTYFVMEPVFQDAWAQGIGPIVREELSLEAGAMRALDPFRTFMMARVDPDTVLRLAALRGGGVAPEMSEGSVPLSVLIPSFMLTEIERAFQIGFLVFLPFLIIDLVVAAILMSMGMMMVPPAIVSLPFKLSFFVVADGWTLVTEALVTGYF